MKLERKKRRGAGELALEMTPMIDVVFLLLIFFMLATTFDERAGIQIELPKASIQPSKVVHNLRLYVDKQKSLQLSFEQEGKKQILPLEQENLAKVLSERFAEAEKKSLVISADESLSHGYIVELMSLAKGAGAESLNIDMKYER